MAAVGEREVTQGSFSPDIITQMELRELKELVKLLLLRVEAMKRLL
ncbi:hypothetical protein HRbin01_00296 [archaeon HR01]|nr:hypothetical protein HRbin01_00296 [archaeon HR01]